MALDGKDWTIRIFESALVIEQRMEGYPMEEIWLSADMIDEFILDVKEAQYQLSSTI